MYNDYWLDQEKIFIKAMDGVDIPNSTLNKVDCLDIKDSNDLNIIPNGGGCYWIWTNEPVKHTLHKNITPAPFNNGEIIYNGIAKDNVKDRLFHHLFGFEDAGWSGISMDIYTKPSLSHHKKACSIKGKVPYINNKPIKTKEQLLQITLSEIERKYIESSHNPTFYFRNGINILDNKHNKFMFKIYYIVGLKSLYLEHIEKKWRENGLPKLCSYISGR